MLWYEQSNLLSSSSSFFLLVPVWVSKEAGFRIAFMDWGCPCALWWLKDPRGIPAWEMAGAHSFLASCMCLWWLHRCLGEGGERKTSFSLLCRAARIGSREVWTSEGLKELLPCPALRKDPFSPDACHGGHAGGTHSPAAMTWSSPLQDNSEISS